MGRGRNHAPHDSLMRRAASLIVEVVFPRRCAGCLRRGTWLCQDCDAALPRFQPPWCARCGAPIGKHPCRCNDLPPALHAVRSAAAYDGWLREAIQSFKYHGETGRAEHLAALLVPLLADLEPFDYLCPVPLHPKRQRRRGYNQSLLLAEGAARVCGYHVEEVAIRIRETQQQARLGANARQANVQGAFAVSPATSLQGARIVLVDDVLTTGATLGSCAAALMAAGAASVSAVTLAREG